MLGQALATRTFSLQRWLRLPAARARCVRHFLGIAATLAAAKVLLSTIGVALFVAEQGAAGLPPFYLGFAAIAILLSFGLSSIIDRTSKVRLAQITFAGLLLGTGALRLPLAFEVPGVSFALLASATAFEIILDIVFWVVVAAYLDAFEFKRATPLVYMALALGGAAGGAIARVGAGSLAPADLLLLTLPLAALVVVQLGIVASQLREVPENHPDAADDPNAGLGLIGLGRLLRRYPLALLIALNALVVTLLYGISEFLILSIYEARFTSEAELAEFLSLLFALMQIVEFGLLYTLTRLLLERTGPLLRNLVFPLASLGGLAFLVLSPRLLAAVVVHVNIEAVSNALFLPIGNANYVPLPLGIQGRARTLSEGIFYPTGLALAGAVLWTTDPGAALFQAEFAALIFAGLFVLLSAGVGLLFLPTLHANVGSGVIRPRQNAAVMRGAPDTSRVRALLQSREVELSLLGLALARHLDPEVLEGDLLSLAMRPERAIKTSLAEFVAGAPERWAQDFVARCLAGETAEELRLALLVMMLRRELLQPEQMPRVLGAHDLAVVALGHVVASGLEAWPHVQPLLGAPGVASELVEAIVAARRTDWAALLLESLEAAEPAQQRRALLMLSGSDEASAAAADIARGLARCADAAVRAGAVGVLSRARPRSAAIRELLAALDDRDGRVRRRAAEGLCQHGDRAIGVLGHRLCDVTRSSSGAVRALARIGSTDARRLLVAYTRALHEDAVRAEQLLDRIAASPDRARWSALEVCLHDHRGRIVEVVLEALLPTLAAPLARRVREALHGADQRSRASAFELIAAGPASRFIPGAVALLRYLLFEDGHGGQLARSGAEATGSVIDQAMLSMSPWVRRAAALVEAGPPLPDSGPRPGCAAGLAGPISSGDHDVGLDDQELERIVALKRTPLFRNIPLETMTEVARSVQVRTYLAGEEVIAGTNGSQDLLVLETGALSIGADETAGKLTAPACLGETALAGERTPWPRITALEDSRVAFLGATTFEELCYAHPELAVELSRLLARRLREAGKAQAS